MSNSESNKPQRRVRYSGTHPRQFQEKYKEHAPERYPTDVAKVLASGKTPAGMHRPIMVAEVLEVLDPQPGQVAIDCTLGYGGHTQALLAKLLPGGRVLATDIDPLELPKTEARLRELGLPDDALLVRRMNYAGIAKLVGELAPGGVDLILADLGVSSMQLDNPNRGFSFKADGPLDMRMNPQHGIPASALLSKLTPPQLAKLLEDNADEVYPLKIAQLILTTHQRTPLTSTRQLLDLVKSARLPLAYGDSLDDVIRRVFQALRIAVNDEFATLDAFLQSLPTALKPGGRVAVITFHSGEDRRVKKAFKAGFNEGIYSEIATEVTRPSMQELSANPRSSSAKLRYAVRACDGVS